MKIDKTKNDTYLSGLERNKRKKMLSLDFRV
jgi:hypothetical protein